MNNIIPASRLGELLAAKTGNDVDACTKFVKEYFGLIEATLARGEDVTIKDIGTFKLTGDDVDPVVYIVDSNLASTVNAPFEAFSAFELADTELIEEPAPNHDEQTSQESVEEMPQEQTEQTSPITVEEIVSKPVEQTAPISVQSVAAEPVVVMPQEPVEATPSVSAKPTEDAPAEKTIEPVVESADKQPIVEPIEEQPIVEPTEEQPIIEPTEEQPVNITAQSTGFSGGLLVIWVVIFFVLGLILGMAGGYFGFHKINEFITGTNTEIEVTLNTDNQADDDQADEITDTIAATAALVSEQQAETVNSAEIANTVETAKTANLEPRYDAISSKCYLTTLARKYYGEMDYWVYIYDANNLGNPDCIRPGTKVRIPYPEELHLTGNSETDLKAAKQRASVIYKKYKA